MRRRRKSAPVLGALIWICGLGLFAASPAQAIHSLPQPWLEYWDVDNDGDSDPAVSVDAAGSGWTTLALDRLKAGISEWSGDTLFDPFYVSSGPNDVYRDGTEPPVPGGFDSDDYAVTGFASVLRPFPGQPGEYYVDISEVDTWFVLDANLPQGDRYWYGAAHSSLSTDVDFQGVWTHELGHWVSLDDLTSANCGVGDAIYTMCGSPGADYDDNTWRYRSLTTDDINAANIPY